MKRTLVTGGTGFVGTNLVRRLLADGHEVHLLVRRGYRDWRVKSIRDSIRLHEVNLLEVEQVQCVVKNIRPEWIFHLAVYGAYSSQRNLHQMIDTNIIGTVNLVNACIQVGFEAFVNTGSSSEYGFKAFSPAEDEWLEPNSHYAVTKATATHFCRYTAQNHNLYIPTLRLYSVYGPYEEPTRLIPTIIIKGLDKTLPPLVNPDIAHDYIYVDDVTEAYIQVASAPNQERGVVYNIGSGTQTSLREVVNLAQDVLEITDQPVWGSMEDRHWDTSTWVANSHKIQTSINWKPVHTFPNGFQKTVEWFLSHPGMQSYYQKIQQS